MSADRKFPGLRHGGGPHRGRGRTQRAARRVALLAGDRLISTSEVVAIVCARRKLLQKRSMKGYDYRPIWRALEALGAIRVRRVPPRGAWLWRLRNSDGE